MPRRVYPVSYLGMLALILLLSVAVTYNFFPQRPRFGNASFFFLGAAFMLIETKAITELGLAFGNTWHVIGIVISGILLMAYLANSVVLRFGIRRAGPWLGLLLVTLIAGYVVSRMGGFGSSPAGKLASLVLLTSPMFFSGIVFSTWLSRAEDLSGVMAVNLVGAMTGGVLEYNSMYFGFRALALLALGLYVLAAMSLLVSRRRA